VVRGGADCVILGLYSKDGHAADPNTQFMAQVAGGVLAAGAVAGLGYYAYTKYQGHDVDEMEKCVGMTFAYNQEKEVVIESITPGGPAEKSGQVHVHDIVKKVGDYGGGAGADPVRDVYKQPVESWCEIIKNGKPGTSVVFELATPQKPGVHKAIIKPNFPQK